METVEFYTFVLFNRDGICAHSLFSHQGLKVLQQRGPQFLLTTCWGQQPAQNLNLTSCFPLALLHKYVRTERTLACHFLTC